MLVIVLYSLWLQSVSMFTTKVTFCCLWIMHICQYMHVTFISLDHCCQVISYSRPRFISLFGGSRSSGISFLLGHTVLQQLIFFLVRSSGEEKLSMFSLCPCPSIFFVNHFAIECVVVISAVTHVLSFPK
jgi:hypothetical protein